MNIAVLWPFLPDEFLYMLYHSNTFVLLIVSIMYIWFVDIIENKRVG